jgi:multisubunit Na+/H+ antiporter MnhF subunit
MNEWLWAAAVLTVLVIGLTLVAVLRPAGDGLVAIELAGTLAALTLLLLAEGTHRQGFVDLALVLAVMSFIGFIAFIRFLGRVR